MIIVTGGAGFIGSYVAAELQAKGYKDIVIVDRLGSDDKWKTSLKENCGPLWHRKKHFRSWKNIKRK